MKQWFKKHGPTKLEIIIYLVVLGIIAWPLLSLVRAQELIQPQAPADYFESHEVLYYFLILPVVQFLKEHILGNLLDLIGSGLERVGLNPAWATIGLSVLVGIGITYLAQMVGIISIPVPQALLFGALAGLVGSGLKDVLTSISRKEKVALE